VLACQIGLLGRLAGGDSANMARRRWRSAAAATAGATYLSVLVIGMDLA